MGSTRTTMTVEAGRVVSLYAATKAAEAAARTRAPVVKMVLRDAEDVESLEFELEVEDDDEEEEGEEDESDELLDCDEEGADDEEDDATTVCIDDVCDAAEVDAGAADEELAPLLLLLLLADEPLASPPETVLKSFPFPHGIADPSVCVLCCSGVVLPLSSAMAHLVVHVGLEPSARVYW